MKNEDQIIISKEKKEEMRFAIKKFFKEERNEELGDLASDIVLDFFIKEIAPEAYNQGIMDSYNFLNERLEDMLGIQK